MILKFAICIGTLLIAIPASASESKPNIVFFLVDDMGWQETSVPFHTETTALNRRYQTPNMERLAQEGMKFTAAYASAVCSPTRVSALTGMNVARHRVTNWTLQKNASPDSPSKQINPPEWNLNGIAAEPDIEHTMQVTPLPALLREAGYRTIHVGKAHFGAKNTPGENPLNLGFDTNIAGHCAGGPGSYWGEKDFSAVWRKGSNIWDVPGLEAYHGSNTYLTEALTLEAIKAVEKSVGEEKPFYLYMSHYAVHAPWEKDDRFYQKYIDQGLQPSDATLASMIEGMDKSLGDIMSALEHLGVADNTIILFMSDNGSPSQCPQNLPLRGHKLTPYEGGIREPMIVKWPGVVKPETTCRGRVVIEDYFPTILELAGADWRGKTLQTVDGRSFVPLLKGSDGFPENRPLVWHFPHNYSGQTPFSAIRVGSWKLIYHHIEKRLELFNIDQDISEKNELSASQPDRVRKLAHTLTKLLKERGAQMPFEKATNNPLPWPNELAKQPKSTKSKVPHSAIARGMEWRGVVLEEKDFTLWDVAPIRTDDGKVHLYVGRWPETNVDPAWRKSSEIAHYVGDQAEGPFRFHDVALRGTGTDTWDKYAPHNPEVRKFGDTYVLTYIANSDFHQPPHPSNQRIGMAVSKSPNGPWRKVGKDGLILEPSADPKHWTFGSQVVNPTLIKVGGRYHLYFKSRCQGQPGTVYGVAIADRLEGPYQITGGPLTTKGVMIEDGFAFEWQGKVCLISTDNHGSVTGIRGGGALWVSEDGMIFNPAWTQVAYELIPDYFKGYDPKSVKKIYGIDPKIERPKLLMENGQPAWLYGPSGWNVTGGQRTVIHALRIHLNPGDSPLPSQ